MGGGLIVLILRAAPPVQSKGAKQVRAWNRWSILHEVRRESPCHRAWNAALGLISRGRVVSTSCTRPELASWTHLCTAAMGCHLMTAGDYQTTNHHHTHGRSTMLFHASCLCPLESKKLAGAMRGSEIRDQIGMLGQMAEMDPGMTRLMEES